jgi:hypothetical protein
MYWVLSLEGTHELFSQVMALRRTSFMQGVPDSPSPDPTSFNKTQFILILVEIGFCKDFGCNNKIVNKTKKILPIIAAFKKY